MNIPIHSKDSSQIRSCQITLSHLKYTRMRRNRKHTLSARISCKFFFRRKEFHISLFISDFKCPCFSVTLEITDVEFNQSSLRTWNLWLKRLNYFKGRGLSANSGYSISFFGLCRALPFPLINFLQQALESL
uniref:Uncharacterized protein n=1 Tax=Sophora flavescens TaxID=49840 RepID=A0A4Y5UYZ8_SOPFL|nr:hypothetical protein FPI08_mgp02 [Sophora flavescens]QDD68267.1 hypothetical protein [Sophora flavescens]